MANIANPHIILKYPKIWFPVGKIDVRLSVQVGQ